MLLLIGPALGLAACAEPELSVMSFNLRYAAARDGANSWRYRKDTLVNTIKHYEPDVMGVQECLASQSEYIARALPKYHWFGVAREANGKGEFSAVFYKKGVLSPIETGNFWISETPDTPGSQSWGTACTRMATWARFRHIKSNRFFYFFNTHLDHVSSEARQEGAKLLVERIGKTAHGHPTVLTGDFNAQAETSAPWQILVEGGMADAWLSVAERAGPETTVSNFGSFTDLPGHRIDWILTRGQFEVRYCETVLYNESGRYPSDHFPVFARLVLPQ